MARLDGKIALITGTGTGIGRATARAMAAEGAKIVVAEINAAAGEQTAQIVVQSGGDCIAVPTDVTQEGSVRRAIETAVRHFGALHILHSNAGGSTPVDSGMTRGAAVRPAHGLNGPVSC
jgi:NAD(P)-dependent dehydrogenase (short-subunit alcohol dehydrogenase family)